MSETAFTYEALPMRVIFGAGSLAQVPAEADPELTTQPGVPTTPG